LKIGDVVQVEVGHPNRHKVLARVLQINTRTIVVRLPDGNIVKRKAGRDFDESEMPKKWEAQ
jgi:hypothetical protein